jgi:hypothetical protein
MAHADRRIRVKQPLEIMTPDRRQPVRNVLVETLLVTAAGIVLAFGANLISPRGLAPTRNYFTVGISRPVSAATGVGWPFLMALDFLISHISIWQ